MKNRFFVLLFALTALTALIALNTNAQSADYCQHCQQEVVWQPLTKDCVSGHLYVEETTQIIPQITIQGSACIDLRGHTLKTEGTRAFSVSSNSTLSIQDSLGGGKVIGSHHGDQTLGGTIYIRKGSVFNLYSGTLTNAAWEDVYVANGGVIHCVGTFNMYGGTIENGVCSWAGGNVYINAGGQMHISGGKIVGGEATVSHTGCVLNRGAITLSGNATIDKIRLWPDGDRPPLSDSLTVDGVFAGKAGVYIERPTPNTDIGNLINGGSFQPENLFLTNKDLKLAIKNNDIFIDTYEAAIYNGNEFLCYANTIAEAISLGQDKTIVLQRNIDTAVTVPYKLTFDLNGYTLSELTVTEGVTLQLKDSATDAFNGSYGKITSYTGDIQAVKGYKLYREESGISSHAYALSVTNAAIRPGVAGMYFVGDFRGDAQLESMVYSFGIIVDITQPPSVSTLNKTSYHTSLRNGFQDNGGVTSILITGVMKERNTPFINNQNADTTVYCRPFIRFTDNTFALGEIRQTSFRDLLEQVDTRWSQEAIPENLQQLYLRFSDAMADWNIPNLKSAAGIVPSPYRVYKPITLADMDALPIATADMTSDELRQLCVDFFRMQLTFQWVSETDIHYNIRGKDTWLKAGTVYAGSPYTATAKSGNLYMTMEYYDQQTGILTNPGMMDQDFMKHIGNHCTYGSFWGWARVINSTSAQFNVNMGLESYGYIPLGDFSTAHIEKWEEGVMDTRMVAREAGKETIFEGYAQLQKADCVYVWFGGGGNSHIRMLSQDAVVVRNADGTINGEESYIIYLDQGSGWTDKTFDGNTIPVQGGVDEKVSFQRLYSAGYLPFTFAEFQGEDPIEETCITTSLDTLETVTTTQLADATVTANYSISHITLSVTDENGNEIYRQNAYAPRILTMEMGISDAVDTEKLAALQGQQLTVTCRLGNGDNVTVFSGVIE